MSSKFYVEVKDLTAWLQHTLPEKDTSLSLPPSQSRSSFCSCYLFFAANPLACQEPGSRNVEQAKKVKLLLGLEYSIKGKDKRHYLQFLLRKMHRPSNICSLSEKKHICYKDIYMVLRILVDCRRRNAYVKSNKMFVLRNHVLMRRCIISLSH
ncbi:hypothetical protein PVAP13_8KG285274 [Panicum virgatum]|uniref:Uncharacterized protein n=1 Tax=Panicum virgatum TaxID=38727 RepID=A0A8T0PQJ2_PANVG|nr:hypothetical protein PVAP13_8KG285274 [Panicum virgatum]